MRLEEEVDGQKCRKKNNRNGGPSAGSVGPSELLTHTQVIFENVEATNDSDRKDRADRHCKPTGCADYVTLPPHPCADRIALLALAYYVCPGVHF